MGWIAWIRRALALPLVWLGQLTDVLHLPISASFWRSAWMVGAAGDDGRSAVLVLAKYLGRDAARAQAEKWLGDRPRCELAGVAGLLAMDAGDAESARAMLDRGRQLGDDRLGMLDFLEFLVVGQTPAGQLSELARRFEQRRDMPAMLARAVKNELLWDALLHQRFDEARGRARHLLQIEDAPQAQVVLCALARQAGDERQAGAHLGRAKLPPAQLAYYQLVAAVAVGRMDEARDKLQQLRQLDQRLAETGEAILGGRAPV